MNTRMAWNVVLATVVGFGAFCTSDNFWTTTKSTIFMSQAEARIGRPLTPFSVAGVARRTHRRAVVAGTIAGGALAYPYGYGYTYPYGSGYSDPSYSDPSYSYSYPSYSYPSYSYPSYSYPSYSYPSYSYGYPSYGYRSYSYYRPWGLGRWW